MELHLHNHICTIMLSLEKIYKITIFQGRDYLTFTFNELIKGFQNICSDFEFIYSQV